MKNSTAMTLSDFFAINELYICISCLCKDEIFEIKYRNNNGVESSATIPVEITPKSQKFFSFLEQGNGFYIDQQRNICYHRRVAYSF